LEWRIQIYFGAPLFFIKFPFSKILILSVLSMCFVFIFSDFSYAESQKILENVKGCFSNTLGTMTK